jgi:putative ABC transport system permease protein
MEEKAVDLFYKNKTANGIFTVLEEGDFVKLQNTNGIQLNLPGFGVVLNKMIAASVGVTVGDEIGFRISGDSEYYYAEVMDITTALTPQGIYISDDSWESIDHNFIPTSVVISSEYYEVLSNKDYFKELTPITNQKANTDELSASVTAIIGLLIMGSLLLSVVILYNLGMLNFVERYREYATMKVIGYTKSEIRNIVLRDCALTTIPGCLIGIPVGFGFLNIFIKVVSFDSYEWITRLSTQNLVLISLLVVGCSVLVNLFISYKVQRIVMTEALKSVE